MKNPFKDRTLLIATRHRKEQVIAPLLEEKLGVRCLIPYDFDTDQFGTFSNEIERKVSPVEALRSKCLAARSLYKTDLVIASEGSFGAHPSFGFVTVDEEWLLLKDFRNNYEIIERELSLETNISGLTTDSEQEMETFATKIGFPGHGLILRNPQTNSLTKGITDWEHLRATFTRYKQLSGKVTIETDMRACYNPSRLKVIESATKKLVQRVLSCCPTCQAPGFGITEAIHGKPCGQCYLPTKSVKAYTYACITCNHREIQPKTGPHFEDPTYCDFCNP